MRRYRALHILLIPVLLFSMVYIHAVPVQPVPFECAYRNTGNQRADIVGVALTQLGYLEGPDNDTKYGTWCDLPNQPWCATFISWCAAMADISPSILRPTGWAHPDYFGIAKKSGTNYTPLPGDLFFTKNYSHVGIVYYVEGDYFYTLEGNSNNSGSSEGIGVVSNKRLISSFVFGVPNYKGTSDGHCYISGQDSAHPHSRYYQCQDCPERYYTGSTGFDPSCKTCTACGCSGTYAGEYICITTDTALRIRSGHGTGYSTVGRIPSGGTVQVLAANGTWAHIRYEAYEGYVAMEYLHPKPHAPVATAGSLYYRGESAKITWDAAAHATTYQVTVLHNGEVLSSESTNATNYTVAGVVPGIYEVQVRAVNQAGHSEPCRVSFTVPDTYTVTYDAGEGTGAPEVQYKHDGIPLQLDTRIPTREGFVFLGWALEQAPLYAQLQPGDSWTGDENITLHAVWRSESAAAQQLTIRTLPNKLIYLPGEAPDPSGMVLQAVYSDGSSVRVTDGITLSGLSSETGVQTVTVTWQNLSVSYTVTVSPYIPGDCNGDRFVNEDDAMYLLRHVLFSETYPVSIPTDLNADGQTNEDDAMYLLRHVLFPDTYPLTMP